MKKRYCGVLLLLASAACADEAAPVIDGFTQPVFDNDLKHILQPEEFEAPSLPPLWPRLSIPALSTAQVSRVVLGNTLRLDDDVAVYFAADGSVEAWLNDWQRASAAVTCPTPDVVGAEFQRIEGECQQKVTSFWKGRWQARDNAVCVDLHSNQATEKQCWHLAVVADRIALFDDTGDMLGRLKLLKRGRVLGQVAD